MNIRLAEQPVSVAEHTRDQDLAVHKRSFHPLGGHVPISPAELELTLLHRWVRMVELYGDNPAVEEAHRILTYAEMNELANRIAHAILDRTASNEAPVALLFDIEGDLAVGIIAAWKAGKFFVWVEPEQPLVRNQFVIEESGAPVVVTNLRHAEMARQLWPDARDLIVIEELAQELPVHDPPITIDPSQTAYLMYTSGSTGKPKATVEPHRNLLYLMAVRQSVFHFSSYDRVAALMLGVGYMFSMASALMYGGCLLPYKAKYEGLTRLGQWLLDCRVTFALAGALLRTWLVSLDGSRQYPNLRLLCLSAGPTYLEHLQAYQRYLPDDCLLANLYSATEIRAGTLLILDKSSKVEGRLLPAGYPSLRGAIEIWDETDRQQPVGETGEIVIFTPFAAAGYWKSPELTARRFGVDEQGRRFYRTGDLGRVDEQGCLWVLGRKDGQLKIRGNRVETAEIEVALLELEHVNESAVVHYGETDEARVLVGFVTATDGVTGDELRRQLATHLPDYMVPSTIVVFSELPRNANGKIARPVLREMAMALAKPTRTSEPLVSATEHTVAGIVAELLRCDSVGPHDNFFDMGGHSLMVALLMMRIHRTFGVDLPPRDFFANPTVTSLARSIDQAIGEQNRVSRTVQSAARGIDAVQLVAGSSELTPLFIIPSMRGTLDSVLSYYRLMRSLGNKHSIYGLVTSVNDESYPLYTTMDELVRVTIAALRGAQPHGPYALMGLCAGGRLAYEVARALEQEGEKVSMLLLMDTPLRHGMYTRRSPLRMKWRQLRRAMVRLPARVRIHIKGMTGVGWREGGRYLWDRLGLILPTWLIPHSVTRERHVVYERYFELLRGFEPTQPYEGPTTAFLTQEIYLYQPSWESLTRNLEVVFVEGSHREYLQVSGDKIAAKIRESLDVRQEAPRVIAR